MGFNYFDIIYIDTPLVIVPGAGAPVVGPNLILPPEKSVIGPSWLISYAPGTPGNTLTVEVQYGEDLLSPPGFDYYSASPPVTVTGTGPKLILAASMLGMSLYRLRFASAGPAAPTDSVRVVATACPTGTIISP